MRRTFDINRTEHGRHHCHTKRTCSSDLFDSRCRHPTDSDNRHTDTPARFLERAHTERRAVDCFGRRFINGTEDDVIGSFGFGSYHFLDGMGRDPDHALSSKQLPRHGDRETIRTQVHADAVEPHRDVNTVIDQQLSLVDGCEPMHLLREPQQVARRQIALTQLNGTHTGRQCMCQHIEE